MTCVTKLCVHVAAIEARGCRVWDTCTLLGGTIALRISLTCEANIKFSTAAEIERHMMVVIVVIAESYTLGDIG